KRLPPGCYMHLKGQELKDVRPVRWWKLGAVPETEPRSFDSVVEETGALLLDAVRLRVITEVPAALQLSGGLDSAIIYECIKKIDPGLGRDIGLYCVSFTQDGIDNEAAARLAAGPGRELRVLSFGAEELQAVLPSVIYHLDTPATWSAICLWFLAQRISADGAKIVLSGEGADELFGGYARYRILYWLDRMMADQHLSAYQPTMQHLFGTKAGVVARLLDHSPRGAQLEHVRALVKRHAAGAQSLLRAATQTEFYTTMQVLLRMGDRMAAAFGLENRCPFLDYRLMELGARLPASYLVNEHESKPVLRAVARALGVSPQITEEKSKRGLAVPWAKWNAGPGTSAAGTRGVWDRASFASLMREAWRKRCLREELCNACNT
ncbi:MAG TPA: asparagine synthase-related protein, partial [Anaerolineae bacterium]|nr:asparagine synthase-related protein [Anaerolineae bacterium]